MTANGSAARRRAGQPMKSPLAAHSRGTTHGRVPELAGSATQGISRAEAGPRAVTLADYADYLRTTNTRKGRPYEEKTVENYFFFSFAGKALDTWMTGQGIDGDSRCATPRCSTGSSATTSPSAARAGRTLLGRTLLHVRRLARRRLTRHLPT
jgi:hypothetical protein